MFSIVNLLNLISLALWKLSVKLERTILINLQKNSWVILYMWKWTINTWCWVKSTSIFSYFLIFIFCISSFHLHSDFAVCLDHLDVQFRPTKFLGHWESKKYFSSKCPPSFYFDSKTKQNSIINENPNAQLISF